MPIRRLLTPFAMLLILAACSAAGPSPTRSTDSSGTAGATPNASATPRLDPGAIVCDPPPMIMEVDPQGRRSEVRITLTCEAAVHAAMKVVPAWPPLRQVEFHYGRWCPPGDFCAFASFDMGYVVFHFLLGAPDQWVPVQLDAAGSVTLGAHLAPWPPTTSS